MNLRTLSLILISVSLSALAQISLKHGMSSDAVQRTLKLSQNFLESALVIGSNSYVIVGFIMYGLGAIVWLLVLAQLDVSVAYPFVGLGFIMTMILGMALLGEPVKLMRIFGTLLVVAGVMFVSNT